VDALGYMVVNDWAFLDGKAYAVVERRSGPVPARSGEP
jgi:hypothetical protein